MSIIIKLKHRTVKLQSEKQMLLYNYMKKKKQASSNDIARDLQISKKDISTNARQLKLKDLIKSHKPMSLDQRNVIYTLL